MYVGLSFSPRLFILSYNIHHTDYTFYYLHTDYTFYYLLYSATKQSCMNRTNRTACVRFLFGIYERGRGSGGVGPRNEAQIIMGKKG